MLEAGEKCGTVVIVDDRKENILAFEVALKPLECALVSFTSGHEALDYLSKNRTAAILLDVQMPVMNGLEVASRLREFDAMTPILFVTAIDRNEAYVASAYRLGAVDFIYKPTDPEVLRAKVRFFVEMFRKTRELEEKTAQLAKTAEAEKTFILEHALDGVVATDEQNRVLFWNEHAERMFGWSKQEALGRDMTDLIVPERLRAGHRNGVKRFLQTGIAKIQNRRIEIPALRKSGEEFPMELTVSSVKTSEGFRFYSFVRDISEQKATALDLKLKSDALENSLNGFDIVDETGTLIYVNNAYVRMWGFDSKDEILGTSPVSHCADPEIPLKIITQLKTAGQCDIEFLARRKDGSTFDVRMLAFLARDSNGREIYPTTSIDITEQRKAQRELKDARLDFEKNVDVSPAILWITEIGGSCSYLSKQWYQFTGQTEEEALGFGWLEVAHPDDQKKMSEGFAAANERQEPYYVEYRLKTTAGAYRWCIGAGNPRYDKSGKFSGYAGTVFDIHDRKLAEDSAKAAKEEAERANELKSAFLANMSHEIRTPLGAMIGFADLLRDPGLSSTEHANYIDVLTRNGEQLSFIINDILDLSKVEAGHLTLEYVPMKPERIMADVISLLSVKAKEKGLVLESHVDPSTIATLVSDPVRVRQVLLNLVSNSIKFTQGGKVVLRSISSIRPTGKNEVAFEVTDTGIGVPEGQTEQIFEMFVQADGSMTRRFGGTGLGLSLSRKLARALGGDVWVEKSGLNRGSTFRFTVEDRPENFDSTQTAHVEPETRSIVDLGEKPLSGMKILVVDDSPDNRQLIWRFLTKAGAVVDSAENGVEGFQAAIAGSHDLVLMDIQMPLMDGYTATHKLRESGYRKPIIALTAHAMSEVRKKCLNVGCSDHLPKPINPKQLISAISRYVTPVH
ncbi:MAG: response regulator [Bdellovibrionota bacterium]